ncbi:MAG: maltose alpha-D-glucosyltransferase [Bacteroidota bacterium]|nr:maltose alpha-D-glucosyltransferase [Bacteroidota bacterium]MDP4195173.1 maltose alpha-D-glucosyltransferase [Bacteroidota bacterium]
MSSDFVLPNDDPLWYKDGIIYQVHVKAFKDCNDDGIGDFRGLIEKLDYIENLGVTIIWLLPFYPSPLKDDGYDIADYYNIHQQYGSIEDFKEFLREAHKRGIKVITELVLNHTSDQHKWFQLARISKPNSIQRDYYVWSNSPEKYKEARIIFGDFETSNWAWDPIAKAYYWHRFYSHQPDLNFDNPSVHKALFRTVDFWLDMGVDGLRLDAVPYLYEREGTNCENLPETHQFLKKLNTYVMTKHRNKMLLAEANQWPEDAVAYFGNDDECQMAFHFPLMPRIFMAIQMEDRFPIVDILEQTPPIPEKCQWAMFLRNHDELTLEMVTDEERDYMYRFYAKDNRARINLGIRRRLAPLVENNRRKIELLNILLFSFPGTPIIYYGDEIGMGDNYYLGDRNGVRTPMQWSPDRNAGFSDTNPQRLYLPVIIDPEYHYEAINVEVQQRNNTSLLWWMRRAITVRKSYKAFGRGILEFIMPKNPKVLAFLRKYEEEIILVVVNLSRFSQVAELDMSKYSGYTPVEAFSMNLFPVFKDSSYMLTMNPYDYYWFVLKKKKEDFTVSGQRVITEISVKKNWKTILEGERRSLFETTVLTDYVRSAPWFLNKKANIREIKITETLPVPDSSSNSLILFLKVEYIEQPTEMYSLAVTLSSGEKAKLIAYEQPHAVIANIRVGKDEYVLIDAVFDESFRQDFLKMLIRKRNIKGEIGELRADVEKRLKRIFSGGKLYTDSKLLSFKNRNIHLLYGEKLVIKLYRKLEEGINPGVELLKVLSEKTDFTNLPPYAGSINYFLKPPTNSPFTLGLMKEFISYQTNGWNYFIDAVKHHFDNVITQKKYNPGEISTVPSLFYNWEQSSNDNSLMNEVVEVIFSDMVQLLGRRTAELHLALNTITDDSAFSPEPFSMLYQRSLYQAFRSTVRSTFQLLQNSLNSIPNDLVSEATELLSLEQPLMNFLKKLLREKIVTKKIRIHGNYHLEQVQFTGKDFVITNFEGIASSSITERKLKRSPLRDIASMIWSFHYASYTALYQYKASSPEQMPILESFAEQWWLFIGSIFIQSYYNMVKDAGFLPEDLQDLEYLLRIYLLDKKMTELQYALSNDLDSIAIPLKGLNHLSSYFSRKLSFVNQ